MAFRIFLPNSSVGKDVIIFGVVMSSSVYIDNKRKDILIIGKGPPQGLDDTTLPAETQFQFIFQN